jgi:hypothetical protein
MQEIDLDRNLDYLQAKFHQWNKMIEILLKTLMSDWTPICHENLMGIKGIFISNKGIYFKDIFASWRPAVKLIRISVLFSFPSMFLAESFTLSPSATQGALLFAM